MSETIDSLTPDKHNARKRTSRNLAMIESSLREVGAARSIVIDENGRILAGNGTVEAAQNAGITRLRVIETDGEEIVAVRRTGLTESQKTRLALADNRSAELAEWDTSALAELADDATMLEGLFTADEVDLMLQSVDTTDWANAMDGLPDGDRAPFQQMTFTVSDAQAGAVKAALTRAMQFGPFDTDNENSNGNALARICEAYNGQR